MKPGDPFDTKQRDELRARQRRELRLVGEGFIGTAMDAGIRIPPDLPSDADEKAILEQKLRDHADAVALHFAGEKSVVLGGLEGHLLKDFLDGQRRTRPGVSFPLAELHEVGREQEENFERGQYDAIRQRIREWLVALILADELAGDYRDSRVKAFLAEAGAEGQ